MTVGLFFFNLTKDKLNPQYKAHTFNFTDKTRRC